jgi:hypothetical protein
LAPLEWHDIEDFLDQLDERPSEKVYAKLKAELERLSKGNLQFRQIVELLHEKLY